MRSTVAKKSSCVLLKHCFDEKGLHEKPDAYNSMKAENCSKHQWNIFSGRVLANETCQGASAAWCLKGTHVLVRQAAQALQCHCNLFLYAGALVGRRTVHYGLVLCKWSRLACIHQPLSPSKSDPSHPTNCSALGSGQRLKSNNGQCEEAYELEVVLGIRRAVTKRTLPHPSLSARKLRTKYCAKNYWPKFKQNRHECTSEIPPTKLPLPLQGLACETKLELKSENIIANQLIEQPMQHLCAKQKAKRLRPMNVCALLSLQPFVQCAAWLDVRPLQHVSCNSKSPACCWSSNCGLWTLIPLGAQLKTARSIQPASQSATHADPSRKASSTCDVASSRLQH